MSNQYPPPPPQPPQGGGSARYLNTPPVGSGRPPTPPKRTAGSKIGCIIGATVVGGLVLLIGVPIGIMVYRAIQEQKAFNPHFESYAAATEFPAIADGEHGYLKPPVVAITIQDNGDTETFAKDPPCFDDLNNRSAFKKLKAEKPEQVRSVILMKWDQLQDGEYEGGAPGYSQTCEVMVVDWDERKVVAVEGFVGEISPEEISEKKKEAFGEAPWDEIEDFLLGLPQR